MIWVIGIVIWILLAFIISALDGNKSSVKKKQRSVSDNSASDHKMSCSHSWDYTGRNERQAASGDKWPNKYYKCSKCGNTRVDRDY